MLLFVYFILALILGVKGQCSLQEKPKIYMNELCSADVSCNGTAKNLMDVVKNNWNCIRHHRQYYYSNQEQYNYDSNYNLNLYIRNTFSDDCFSGIIDVSSKIQVLDVEKGGVISLEALLSTSFPKLNEFSITYNKLETISLRHFLDVKTVNVSHNDISNIQIDMVENTRLSQTITIDLSHNALESIPNNCFSMFPMLKYLDLSFNMIKQFDILTFEGIIQLEILQLSNNKILEIGQNFARFMKLKYLTLDNNELTSLTDLNFRTLISLEKLNLSSNSIKSIEDETFSTLVKLEQLDLSQNKINIIRQPIFKSNKNLYRLLLSCNSIEKIEEGAFKVTNISHFDIENNIIGGAIEYDTFLGISVESLNLSNGNIRILGDKAFGALGRDLKYLNLSANLIENITESAFLSLQVLRKLDLSCNRFIDTDFNTSDLTQLTEYYLHNNNIKKVTPRMFTNMTSLNKLDLSQNKIEDIEFNSFVELINLKEFNMSNNLLNSLKSNVFRGLSEVKLLDLSNTRSISCHNESFSGMVSLTFVNLSNSQLETIEYETFQATGAIKIIDLSCNMLEKFHVNTSSISKLTELNLSHNKLANITSETFKNLHHLENINLAFNNILSIDSNSLQTLTHLRYLDFLFNTNLLLKGDVFDNLILSKVSLSKVQQLLRFENSYNTTISKLILSDCEIEDINSVHVSKFRNVLTLDISSNKIKALDKDSFLNMDVLNWLDISSNMISTIQPGTFLSNKMINSLSLYGNNLKSINFGVLDGLKNVRVLNLSNNEIHILSVNILHNLPHLSELFLENNNLESIGFTQLSKTSVKSLTIGGNNIFCDAFAEWDVLKNHNLKVTAENPDFDSENVHGISCKGKTMSLQEKSSDKNTYNVADTLKSEVIEIKKSIEQLHSYLKISMNETISEIISYLRDYPQYLTRLSTFLNHSQIISNEQIGHVLNENKNLLPLLANKSDNVESDIKLIISLLEKNNNLTKLYNNDKNILQTPVVNKVVRQQDNQESTTVVPKMHGAHLIDEKLESVLSDIRVLLYIIVVCFAIVILFCVVILTNKYLYRQGLNSIRVNNLYDSGQSVRNGLEME